MIGLVYVDRAELFSAIETYQRDRKWAKEDAKGPMIKGMKNGEWKTYFKNGRLASVENYKNDTLNGPRIFYFPDGQCQSRMNYKMGIQVDSFFFYSSNGKVSHQGFSNPQGKDEGPFKIYHDNGQLSQIGQYVNGYMDGEFRSFYKSGKLKEVQYYKMNKKTGTWIQLSEAGDTIKVEHN